MQAFWVLSTCRGTTFSGVGPIPWTATHQFAEVEGYTHDEILYGDFMSAIAHLDRAFMEIQRDEIGKKTRGTNSAAGLPEPFVNPRGERRP